MHVHYIIRRINILNASSCNIKKEISHLNERYHPIYIFENKKEALDHIGKLKNKKEVIGYQVEEISMSDKMYDAYIKFCNKE